MESAETADFLLWQVGYKHEARVVKGVELDAARTAEDGYPRAEECVACHAVKPVQGAEVFFALHPAGMPERTQYQRMKAVWILGLWGWACVTVTKEDALRRARDLDYAKSNGAPRFDLEEPR